ncbi:MULTISPECIES: flagellar hook assembly protein FlgD [Bacillaceae]|uniref:flagellar hook assembly protein FlgD n=1 Tax=Bacillaceae TaxID=186817 RepID=UPI001BDE6B76|nr:MULTISPECIES: flagellar hook assembly protein FlgD [Bacillaceae]MDX8362249.1 flagellar hook assembly protein FlgD [Cytobacillus sp. IB215316]
MATTIPADYYLSSYQNEERNTGSDILGKDDFLKILMTQLQNQDPLNPMQDKDFIAQMATFSSLEQMMAMSESMELMLQQSIQSNLVSYNQFVGKDVTYHKEVIDEDGSTIVEGTGVISSIQYINGEVYFELEDGSTLELGNISGINHTTTDNHILQGSELIGKSVMWQRDDGTEMSATVLSVLFNNGQTTYQLDDADGTTISASQILKISA